MTSDPLAAAKPSKPRRKTKTAPAEDEMEAPVDDFADLDAAEPLAEAEEEPAKPRIVREIVSKRKTTAKRRATVRYYTTMNPERVYPLLVLITRAMVEKVQKQCTDQRTSGPFQVDVERPIEIEPVLPGCDCHPPKVVTPLYGGDLTLTFRVVPRVLGRLDGASVFVRQHHAVLAEIKLETKVVRRAWVVLSGAMTFVVPGLSAILKHFGLDFQSQREDGFSLYLSVARLLFDWVSPLSLTAALGLVTILLWWLTRPRTRDVFFDIEKVGPGEKLRRIAVLRKSDRDRAATDLLELVRAFPGYQPARLFYAEWHYDTQNYAAAFKGYDRAFQLGVTKAHHYHKAANAASRLGSNEQALRILQLAEQVLPRGQMTGAMLYNLGCYHVRLGKFREAMACLYRAVAAGYTKQESFRKDPDLDPLRNRSDFKQLLADLA
jgi:hypothetical protein